MNVNEVRDDLRRVSMETEDFPELTDVVPTKAGQLITKVPTRQDSEKLKKLMDDKVEKVTVTLSSRRRSRILLLSLDPDLAVEEITKTIDGVFCGHEALRATLKLK